MDIKETINFEKINNDNGQFSAQYQQQHPFPYIIFDDFLQQQMAEAAGVEFPSPDSNRWTYFFHFNKNSNEINNEDLIPKNLLDIIRALNSEEFMTYLRKLTGIENLISDPAIAAGGLLMTRRGGYLNIHADFATHPRNSRWRRRVNVLIYMNKNWKEEYAGHLELWSKDMKTCERRILPGFNRCVIFNTDRDCFHGHPEPLKCPENDSRKVIALYYFTEERESSDYYTTHYKARPADRLKRVFIQLDYHLLKAYNRVKVTFGFTDNFASKVLRFFKFRK